MHGTYVSATFGKVTGDLIRYRQPEMVKSPRFSLSGPMLVQRYTEFRIRLLSYPRLLPTVVWESLPTQVSSRVPCEHFCNKVIDPGHNSALDEGSEILSRRPISVTDRVLTDSLLPGLLEHKAFLHGLRHVTTSPALLQPRGPIVVDNRNQESSSS
jgi:hypothetical protein